MTTSRIYPFTINNVPVTEPVEFKIELPYPKIDEYNILEEMSTKMVALQKANWEAALKPENQPIVWQSYRSTRGHLRRRDSGHHLEFYPVQPNH